MIFDSEGILDLTHPPFNPLIRPSGWGKSNVLLFLGLLVIILGKIRLLRLSGRESNSLHGSSWEINLIREVLLRKKQNAQNKTRNQEIGTRKPGIPVSICTVCNDVHVAEVPVFELFYSSLGTFPDHGSIVILNLQILIFPTIPKSLHFEELFLSLIKVVGL